MSYAGKSAEKFNEILKEVKLLRTVRHKNVVEFHGSYLKEKEHSAWICMEYCLGSASDLVEVQQKKLSEPEVAQIIRNVLQGLRKWSQLADSGCENLTLFSRKFCFKRNFKTI